MDWISTDECLPDDREIVLVAWWNIHCSNRNNYLIARFVKGRTADEVKESGWVGVADQDGNNKKPYMWADTHSGLRLFGQNVTHWMHLPEPPQGKDCKGYCVNGEAIT